MRSGFALFADANLADLTSVTQAAANLNPTVDGATATGTNAASAYPISAVTTVFTSVATGTGAVLPAVPGLLLRIINRDSNQLTVYPSTGATIDGSASVWIAAGGVAEFIMTSPTIVRAI